jgi:RNA polymerase sigma factor (sigma-70 family)
MMRARNLHPAVTCVTGQGISFTAWSALAKGADQMYAATFFHDADSTSAVAEIDRIWRAEYAALIRRARRYARGQEDVAEALVAQTALRILGHVRRGQLPVSNMESLFYVSLRNTALDYWRGQNRRLRTFEPFPDLIPESARETLDASAHLLARQEMDRAMGAARQLAAHLRELFDLHIVEGRSYREIAETLDISEALARKRMQLARRALRQALDDIDPPKNVGLSVHNPKLRASFPFDRPKSARG